MADSKEEPKLCGCLCHKGKPGFYHCFSVCCDEPDVVCDPPPPQLKPMDTPKFTSITFPTIKKVFPGDLSDIIVGASGDDE
jgi:hypothetical protein